MKSHPVAPGRTPSNPVAPRQTRSHLGHMGVMGRMARPVAVKRTLSQSVKPRRTWSHPVKPGRTWDTWELWTDGSSGGRQTRPVAVCQTPSHPVKAGQTWSNFILHPSYFILSRRTPSNPGRIWSGFSYIIHHTSSPKEAPIKPNQGKLNQKGLCSPRFHPT
jgi:hypothetical protein